MLHSGHIRFLQKASELGDLYVAIGSDPTILELKGRAPMTTEDERKYMLEAVRYVKHCVISRGTGILDFEDELRSIKPDIFVVNEDGNTPAKEALCRKKGIKYVVLSRDAFHNLPARSTTSLRRECRIPYRLDLAGGWLDQPFVSKHFPGPVLTISIEPNIDFNQRSGMASSTRQRAVELWQTNIPQGDREKLARILFSFENPPGTKEFSGSQDAIGIVFPGMNKLDYHGGYWPIKIHSNHDEKTLKWIENCISMVPLGPRGSGFSVFKDKKITPARARALSLTAENCWTAINARDVEQFGKSMRDSFEAQISMFPGMLPHNLKAVIQRFGKKALGWKLSGAGGGGYLVLVSREEIPNTIKLKIRRAGE